MLSSVDLPHPLGPTIATNAPDAPRRDAVAARGSRGRRRDESCATDSNSIFMIVGRPARGRARNAYAKVCRPCDPCDLPACACADEVDRTVGAGRRFIFALIGTPARLRRPRSSPRPRRSRRSSTPGDAGLELIPFTLQMSLVSSPVTCSLRPRRSAVSFACWPHAATPPRRRRQWSRSSRWRLVVNWGFAWSSAPCSPRMARRVEGVDYRALAAASFSDWAASGLRASAGLPRCRWHAGRAAAADSRHRRHGGICRRHRSRSGTRSFSGSRCSRLPSKSSSSRS